jgi:toxin ParE1/3/4
VPKLIWTEGAKNDVDEIRKYVKERSPKAAARIGKRIKELVAHLKTNPEMGPVGRWPGTRELVITDTPYIVLYVVEDEGVLLLGVIHGAQDRDP